MVFVNANGGGLAFAFPDVCNTPTPVGPVPIPYPNIAPLPTAIPSVFNVLIPCMPAHNMMTTVPMTNGDNGGVAMGLMSGTVMGPSSPNLGSTKLFLGTGPATRMTDVRRHNSTNSIGIRIVPSQFKVICLN